EKGIGIYAVFLKILIIGMDFRARKGFYMDTLLIISSSHHQQLHVRIRLQCPTLIVKQQQTTHLIFSPCR
ncbi:hypothetical protein ACVWCE_01675, partial [Escherichia coli]